MDRVKVVLTKEWQEYLLELVKRDTSVPSQFQTDVIKALTVHGMPDEQAGKNEI